MLRSLAALLLVLLIAPREASCARNLGPSLTPGRVKVRYVPERCRKALVDPTIHDVVTGREYDRYALVLEQMSKRSSRDLAGKHGRLKPFPGLAKVVDGEISILDLGGGNSDFGPTLLRRRAQYLEKLNGAPTSVDNIHVADQAYRKPRRLEPATQMALREFPDNFHGMLFQELDLRDANGERMQFDEIVSGYSLSYVLANSIKSPTEVSLILDRVLEHLKPGGSIRMWVGSMRVTFYRYLDPALAHLKAKGKISNYSDTHPDLSKFPVAPMIIQK